MPLRQRCRHIHAPDSARGVSHENHGQKNTPCALRRHGVFVFLGTRFRQELMGSKHRRAFAQIRASEIRVPTAPSYSTNASAFIVCSG